MFAVGGKKEEAREEEDEDWITLMSLESMRKAEEEDEEEADEDDDTQDPEDEEEEEEEDEEKSLFQTSSTCGFERGRSEGGVAKQRSHLNFFLGNSSWQTGHIFSFPITSFSANLTAIGSM